MNRKVTWEELAQHNKPGDYWMAIGGRAFNVTKYLAEHPGGDDILIKYAGRDATTPFEEQLHTEYAKSLRTPLLVGDMDPVEAPKSAKEETIKMNKNIREITYEELATHNTEKDCWILINGIVYHPTADFIDSHPGGPSVIMKKAGKDATKAFDEVGHSKTAMEQLKDMIVGKIKEGSKPVSMAEDNEDKITLKQVLVLIAGLCICLGLYFFFNR